MQVREIGWGGSYHLKHHHHILEDGRQAASFLTTKLLHCIFSKRTPAWLPTHHSRTYSADTSLQEVHHAHSVSVLGRKPAANTGGATKGTGSCRLYLLAVKGSDRGGRERNGLHPECGPLLVQKVCPPFDLLSVGHKERLGGEMWVLEKTSSPLTSVSPH